VIASSSPLTESWATAPSVSSNFHSATGLPLWPKQIVEASRHVKRTANNGLQIAFIFIAPRNKRKSQLKQWISQSQVSLSTPHGLVNEHVWLREYHK
jgi:hypothetical protein